MALVKIGAAADVPPGTLKELRAEGRAFAVCNIAGEIRVFNGECACAGGPVGQGKMFDGVMVCPWHGMRYSVDTGECTTGSFLSIERYPTVVEGGDILVDLD